MNNFCDLVSAPILFIIFNRPDNTKQSFEAIKNARPRRLYIAADGPRPDRVGENALCDLTRQVVQDIDWECDVFLNFSENNMGCKKRVSSAISWVFETEDRLIIIEDDCLASSSFFDYCCMLLEHYKDDSRIGAICGSKFVNFNRSSLDSYIFSKYPTVWGWATWKRVWDNYSSDISDWNERKNTEWLKWKTDEREFQHWSGAFDGVCNGAIDTWDYQFVYLLWKQSQLSIHPSVNLISNTGFGPNATHTKKMSDLANLSRRQIEFPLNHPDGVFANGTADLMYMERECVKKKRKRKIFRYFDRIFR